MSGWGVAVEGQAASFSAPSSDLSQRRFPAPMSASGLCRSSKARVKSLGNRKLARVSGCWWVSSEEA